MIVSCIFTFVGVLKQVVRRKLFVLIAGEISLNNEVPRKSESAKLELGQLNVKLRMWQEVEYPFDCISLLFCDMNLSCARGNCSIILFAK